MRIKNRFSQILKSPTFATLSVFAGANVVSSLLSGIGGIIQARWITPDLLGEFAKYGILTSYLAIFLVVVQDGLARQFPYYIGKGQKDRAIEIAAAAKCWYCLMSLLFGLLFVFLTVKALCQQEYRAAAGWGCQIVASIALSYGVYLQTIYRRSMEFKRLSYNGLLSGVAGFFAIIGVKFCGYFGVAFRMLCLNVTRLVLDARYVPLKIKTKWDWRCFIELAKISVPLSVEGYIRTSFMNATFGYLVVRYCGERDLGLYGIAIAFEHFAMLFVTSMMQIFDVKMANKFGENDSIQKGFHALVLPTLLGVACAFALAIGLCFMIGPFIRAFVPRYEGAIPIVYVLSLGLPFGVAFMPTRLLRVALRYKSIYTISIVRVVALVISVQFVPHTIIWFAGCKMFAELMTIVAGLILLYIAIREEGKQNE